MNIGLVIVNYNDSKNTIKLIKNVSSYKSIESIVVVDNNSSLSDINKIKELKVNNLTIIENDGNYGYAYALNIGAKYLMETLDNPLICLSNTDIHIPNEEVITSMSSKINQEIKCVMPKVKEGNNFKYGWRLTSASSDLKANIPLFNRIFRKDIINYPDEYFKANNEVDVIYGCFFMIEGKTLESINYFDDKTFLYYEEYILARKLRNINVKSIVDTSIYVEHLHNAVIGSNVSNKNKYKIYKKSQLYYEKKYNKANIFEIALFRLFYLINLIPYEIKSLIKKD